MAHKVVERWHGVDATGVDPIFARRYWAERHMANRAKELRETHRLWGSAESGSFTFRNKLTRYQDPDGFIRIEETDEQPNSQPQLNRAA